MKNIGETLKCVNIQDVDWIHKCTQCIETRVRSTFLSAKIDEKQKEIRCALIMRYTVSQRERESTICSQT